MDLSSPLVRAVAIGAAVSIIGPLVLSVEPAQLRSLDTNGYIGLTAANAAVIYAAGLILNRL